MRGRAFDGGGGEEAAVASDFAGAGVDLHGGQFMRVVDVELLVVDWGEVRVGVAARGVFRRGVHRGGAGGGEGPRGGGGVVDDSGDDDCQFAGGAVGHAVEPSGFVAVAVFVQCGVGRVGVRADSPVGAGAGGVAGHWFAGAVSIFAEAGGVAADSDDDAGQWGRVLLV